MPFTDDEIHAIITDYETDRERAMERRDQRLREALASGRIQADLIRVTGLSREAMRQALNPAAREAARKARATKQSAPSPPVLELAGKQTPEEVEEIRKRLTLNDCPTCGTLLDPDGSCFVCG